MSPLAEAVPLQDFHGRQIYLEAIRLLRANNLDKALKQRHLRAGHLYGIQ